METFSSLINASSRNVLKQFTKAWIKTVGLKFNPEQPGSKTKPTGNKLRAAFIPKDMRDDLLADKFRQFDGRFD